MNEMNQNRSGEKKTSAFSVRPLLLLLLIIIVAVPIVKAANSYVEKRHRLEELQKQPGYFAYASYFADDGYYRFYYMLNAQTGDDILSRLTSVVDSDFIAALRQSDVFQESGVLPIELRVMIPDEELEYGFERNAMNIELIDYTLMHRHTEYIVIIPPSSTRLDECQIKAHNHSNGSFDLISSDLP